MTIRQTLFLFISILALLISGFAATGFYSTWQKKNLFEFSKQSSESINLLLTAAGNWAVERGVTNSGLGSASNASDKMLKMIDQRRNAGDVAFEEAMIQIENYNFAGKNKLVSKVQSAYQSVTESRTQADQNLLLPQIRRDSTLLKSWVPTMSKLIVLSQDLRFALTQVTAETDPELGRQAQLKHFSWIMSEFSGRERAIIGGMISGGLGLSEDKLMTLSRFRGNVETGWDIVQKLAAKSNQEVRETIQTTKSLFFGDFQAIRESIYEASINGDDLPLDTQGWIDESTKAINTILATQAASTKETESYVETLLSDAEQTLLFDGLILIVSLLVVLATLYTVIFRVVRPIGEMTEAMNILAEGDTSVEVPATGRNDEIGYMAESVLVFKENAIERAKMREEQKEAVIRAEQEKKDAMNQLADSFERRVQSIITTVSSASAQLSQTSSHMNGMIEESNQTASEAAAGASQTSANVQSVASAAEEMSATVKEISNQIHQSNSMVADSVRNVENADAHAQALSEASHKVKEVVQLISDIAGQINLLALNATIESARAGDAGKGFAVVASEVKNLAGQTDKSIQEIETVITEMNDVSGNIVRSLNTIKQSVENISGSSSGIASAVEEQSATTNEIAANMLSAAQGTQNITQNLEKVSIGGTKSQSAAEQVLSAAEALTKQSQTLDDEVKAFLSEIRAA